MWRIQGRGWKEANRVDLGMIQKDEEMEAISRCIGRAVAPYAFELKRHFHDDREYADNVPFTCIKTEAVSIQRMIEKARNESNQRIGAC